MRSRSWANWRWRRRRATPASSISQATLRDQGIRTVLVARKTPEAVTRLDRGWTTSFNGWLAVTRGRGQQVLHDTLPQRSEGLATALLLGEGSSMTKAEWDKYIRTGVIHVLAISGQHLVILAAFLWFVLPRLGIRQRRAAWIVALVLLGYALLTGGRPPALRSAVTVCAVCGGLILRRRVLPANLFALSWLAVALVNPTDLFTSGCLLSFLSVAVLYWGTQPVCNSEEDPLARLIDASAAGLATSGLRWLGRRVFESYAITVLIWLAITPLAASRYQMISPSGLVLGPPLVLLTTVALFAGFLLLLTAVVCPPLTGLLDAPRALEPRVLRVPRRCRRSLALQSYLHRSNPRLVVVGLLPWLVRRPYARAAASPLALGRRCRTRLAVRRPRRRRGPLARR